MVTVAFVEVIRLIAPIWVPLTRGKSGLSGIPKPSLLGMILTHAGPASTTWRSA